jgi:hypothetical protein
MQETFFLMQVELMPVVKRGRYWYIGSGKAKYKTKKDALKAYSAYLAKKRNGKRA